MSENTSESIATAGAICRIYRRYTETVRPALQDSTDFKAKQQSEILSTYFGKELLKVNLHPEVISEPEWSLDALDTDEVGSDVDRLLQTAIFLYEVFESSQKDMFQRSSDDHVRDISWTFVIDMRKELAELGLDIKSIEPGEEYDPDDPELRFVRVEGNIKGDDRHPPGTVNSVLNRHGFEYRGKTIKEQKIIINY